MANNTGQVVQVQGGVVDVEFADGQLPGLFEAIEIEREGTTPLVLEVQKHLGEFLQYSEAVLLRDAKSGTP